MTRWRTHRLIAVAAAVPMVVALESCGPALSGGPAKTPKKILVERENDVGTGQAPLGGAFGSPVPVAPSAIPHRPTPELAHKMDGITETDFIDDIKDLYYDYSPANSQPRFADCLTGASACNGSADLYIEPEIGMNMRAHHNGIPASSYKGIPANGVIVARIINYSLGGQASNFGFPAGQYTWWVVDYDAGGYLRSRFFVRDYASHTVVPLKNTANNFTVYDWKDCKHFAPGRPSRARWYDCDDSYDEVNAMRLSRRPEAPSLAQYVRLVAFTPFSPPRPAMTAASSVWITCAEGCCTSSVALSQ